MLFVPCIAGVRADVVQSAFGNFGSLMCILMCDGLCFAGACVHSLWPSGILQRQIGVCMLSKHQIIRTHGKDEAALCLQAAVPGAAINEHSSEIETG